MSLDAPRSAAHPANNSCSILPTPMLGDRYRPTRRRPTMCAGFCASTSGAPFKRSRIGELVSEPEDYLAQRRCHDQAMPASLASPGAAGRTASPLSSRLGATRVSTRGNARAAQVVMLQLVMFPMHRRAKPAMLETALATLAPETTIRPAPHRTAAAPSASSTADRVQPFGVGAARCRADPACTPRHRDSLIIGSEAAGL
jgi:hypothetical protein